MDRDGESKGKKEKPTREGQEDSESEEETTEALSVFDKGVVLVKEPYGKGKKRSKTPKSVKLMNESYMTMPNTTGAGMPVYADCKEAEVMEFITEEEETALLTRVAFAKHLPKQCTNTEFTKTLAHLSHRGKTEEIREMTAAFKEAKQEEKSNRQKANLLYQLANLVRIGVAADRNNQEKPGTAKHIPEDVRVQMEQVAVIADRVAARRLQQAKQKPYEQFLEGYGLQDSPELQRIVTDPRMMDKSKRSLVLEQLTDALEVKEALAPMHSAVPGTRRPQACRTLRRAGV